MPPVRLGAVGYLNARPLVYGLNTSPRFVVRFDVPSRCADLLHEGAIDVGLIPSIEYLRRPPEAESYAIVPDLSIASDGPVASVAVFTSRPLAEVRTIAVDTSSRTSVALLQVLCARSFGIRPVLEHRGPDLSAMLSDCDAALIIGDNALLQAAGAIQRDPDATTVYVEKVDLGEAWTRATGLPFVYAFWAGRVGCLTTADIEALRRARDLGVQHPDDIAREYFAGTPERQAIGAGYLQDNIKYSLGARERAGLELFYRYALEVGAVESADELRFFRQT